MSGYKTSSKKRELHFSYIKKFLDARPCDDARSLLKKSPITIPRDSDEQFATIMESLFEPGAVVELKAAKILNKAQKAVPCGTNLRRLASQWVQLAHNGSLGAVLGEHSGVFMRVNPVTGVGPGSGANGATTDLDVAGFHHALIEHDNLPMDLQVNLLSRLALPICAIIESGGTSIHALIKINAENAETYSNQVKELHATLGQYFGFDTSTSNPSRLTRAPGFLRREPGKEERMQRLLYINPNPSFTPIAEL